MTKKNLEDEVIKNFGEEWELYNQNKISFEEKKKIFHDYFANFPFQNLSENSVGFDLGCGSGRWAYFLAPKINKLFCIEPSKAIEVAKKNLGEFNNVIFLKEKVSNLSLKNETMDFGYSLGVLHHIENTEEALRICVNKLKKNAPFLIYLYYNFENKPFYFKLIFFFVDKVRLLICKLPLTLKKILCNIIAAIIYFPLAKISKLLKLLNISSSIIPLNYYCDKSFYVMMNDSLDRFGTKLEKRYSKKEIKILMNNAGLKNIIFNKNSPYWVALGYKK
jgi:SAM-dependent methyltransferase